MMNSESLPPSILEAGLLGSINSLERLTRVQVSGITQQDFAVWPGVYKFICDHAESYSGVPVAELIHAQWEDYNPPIGDFEYWLGEFLKRTAARKAQILIKDSLAKIEDNPSLAIPELIAHLAGIQYAGNTHLVATDAGIGERLDYYNNRKEIYQATGGNYLYGIPSGLAVIDKSHQGWMAGELVGFYARPAVGKTWMLVREAAIAWSTGARVLLISPEVSAAHVALRIDVFLAHYLGIKLSHKAIFEGNPSQEASYEALTKIVQESERWWTVDSIQGRPLGLRDIKMLIQQFQPDMICIDGVMLLHDDERAKEGWQKIENICYGLKHLATAHDLVVMASHQATKMNTSKKDRGTAFALPSFDDASGGQGFLRACTTIFSLAPDQTHEHMRWYAILKTREREVEGMYKRFALGWDVDRGHIEDLGIYGEDLIVLEQQLGRFE